MCLPLRLGACVCVCGCVYAVLKRQVCDIDRFKEKEKEKKANKGSGGKREREREQWSQKVESNVCVECIHSCGYLICKWLYSMNVLYCSYVWLCVCVFGKFNA